MMLACNERYPGFGFWAAIEKPSGEFLGWFCLRPHAEPAGDNVGLGYRLRRATWGQGYATEGSRALIDRAFTTLSVRRVFATTYGENLASRRVMEKAGLRLARTFRLTEDGESVEPTYDDSSEEEWPGEDVEYALERDEWLRPQSPTADEIAKSADV
jgi:RimJ/RimL family protein N-acetyltransferase